MTDPRPGMRFLHARQLKAEPGTPVKEWLPEECVVTKVKCGRVYFRNSTGFLSWVALDKFSDTVRVILDA